LANTELTLAIIATIAPYRIDEPGRRKRDADAVEQNASTTFWRVLP
jgi:hypothetical protein